MKKIKKRLLKGLGANAFGQISTIIIQLVNVPIFLHFWGIELYGEWLILSTLPSYFAMSDIGFANVAANEMTMQVARGNKQNALEIFQSIWLFISIICLIFFLVLTSVIWFIPLENWLNLNYQTHQNIVFITLVFTLHILIKLQGGLLEAGFRCDGKYALGVFLNNIIRILESIAILVVVCINGSLLAAASAFLGIRIFGLVLMRFILKKNAPWIIYGFRYVDWNIIKNSASPAIAFMGFPLSYALINQGLTTVVAVTLEPASVVIFSALRTVSRLAFQVMVIINSTVWPEISAAYGASNLSLARDLHRYSCQLSIWLSGFAILFLSFFGELLLSTWTRGNVEMNFPAFYLMLGVIAANSVWLTSSVVPSATNKHQKISIFFVLSTILSIITASFLTPKLGIAGTAMSMLITDLLMSLLVVNTSLKLLKDDKKQFILGVLKPPPIKMLLKA